MPSSSIESHETPEAGNAVPTSRLPAPHLAAIRYRVWQLWRSITPHQLEDTDHAILDSTLPPAGRQLFASMSENDQHHSLMVYHALCNRGCIDGDMLVAALLHDSGKGGGRVPVWVRPLVVLTRAFMPGLLPWLAQSSHSWWRRPFYNAWHHAAIGADLAAIAGLSERTVLLIRTHHQPDGPAAELHALDDAL